MGHDRFRVSRKSGPKRERRPNRRVGDRASARSLSLVALQGDDSGQRDIPWARRAGSRESVSGAERFDFDRVSESYHGEEEGEMVLVMFPAPDRTSIDRLTNLGDARRTNRPTALVEGQTARMPG